MKQIEATHILGKFVLLSMSNISLDTIVYTIELLGKLFSLIPHTFIELLLSVRHFTFIRPVSQPETRGECSFLSGTDKETEVQSASVTCPSHRQEP